ncbi:MAG: hypothetical protein AAB263_19530, partial [Planctomycetota bacterium]
MVDFGNQADIDKLLASMGAGKDPVAPEPTAVAAPTTESSPVETTAANTPGIDKQTASSAKPPAAEKKLNSNDIDVLMRVAAEVINPAMEKASAGKPATSSSKLDQTEIDQLLSSLNPETRKKQAATSGGRRLSQEFINKVLKDVDAPSSGSTGSVVASAPVAVSAVTSGSANAASAAVATTMSAPVPVSTAPLTPVPASAAIPVTADSKIQPAASLTGSKFKARAQTSVSAEAGKESPLSQADIDRMLAELGGDPPAVSGSAQAESVPSTNIANVEATHTLSTEELERIVAKQSDVPPGAESEAVIDQADIDALVKQLAQATGAPEEQQVADVLAGKTADIERIQAEAAQPLGPEMTRDAVDINSVLGRTASTASLHPQPQQTHV